MRTVKTLAALALAVLLYFSAGAQTAKYSSVRIYPPADREQRAELLGLLHIDHFFETDDGAIVSEVSAQDMMRLKKTNCKFQVLVDDVAARLKEENARYYKAISSVSSSQARSAFEHTGTPVDNIIFTPSAFLVQPSFGGYYSFAQMQTAMNNLVSSYPTLVQKTSLGLSHEGRDIWCIKISDNVAVDETNEPEVLYMGLQHAREAIGGSSMIFLMQYLCEGYSTDPRIRDLIDNREIFIIPCMNPDGWEYNRLNGGAGSGWRKNRRNNGSGEYGVDLNRNWGVDWGNCSAPIIGNASSCGSNDPSDDTYFGPAAFSEPETQAVRNFTYTKHLVAMIDQHAYGPYYSLPFGRPSLPANTMSVADDEFYKYVSAAMGNYNGMRAGNSPESVGYEVAGGVKDWMLKGNIGTGSKGKVMGMTGEGGAGGGSGGSFGSFWAPAAQIIPLCKGMVYQDLQLLYAAGSYVNLQDQSDIALNATSGSLGFHIKRVGLEDRPVTVSLIPIENLQSVGSPVTISTLPNYYDTYNGNISYILPASITAGKRIRFAWKVETGGYSWTDTITKFYNPTQLFYDNMEGSSVATNWTVTGGWDYTAEDAYAGSGSLTESPGGNYTSNSTRRATYNGSFDLSDATAAFVSFWVKHRAENFYDKLQIRVSNDNGSTWTAIAGSTTVQEPGTLDGSTLDGNPSLTGIKEEWTRELFDLHNWIGASSLRLRLEFTSGPSNSFDYSLDDGFHIDNLKVIKSTATLVTLPVHFISFTGKLLPDYRTLLQWNAVTDEAHDYFEVERSPDGTHFTAIGYGPVAAPYQFIDPSPMAGNNYYRVRQVDKDGDATYSNVISIPVNWSSISVEVYPNPVVAVARVQVNGKAGERYLLSIVDVAGRTIREEYVTAGIENSIDMASIGSGIYVLRIYNARQELIGAQRISKQP